MATILNYQTTEYDCGSVSFINALRFLYKRSVIRPELLKQINNVCMDAYDRDKQPHRKGTSNPAMQFLASWMNEYALSCDFPVLCTYINGTKVELTNDSAIVTSLRKGAVCLLRYDLIGDHWSLLTGATDSSVYIWDSYFMPKDELMSMIKSHKEEVQYVPNCPDFANRLVPFERLNRVEVDCYTMGPVFKRAAVIIRDTSYKN